MSASAPERRLDETRSQTPAQPWKSGASAPRQDFRIMNRALAPETSIISSTRICHSEPGVKPGEQPDVASRQTPQPRLPHFSRFFARSGIPQLSPSWDFDLRRINRESHHRASPHTPCHSESAASPVRTRCPLMPVCGTLWGMDTATGEAKIDIFEFGKSDESQRQMIRNIVDSYHHEWDVLAELCQNAIDAIREKNPGKARFTSVSTARTVASR